MSGCTSLPRSGPDDGAIKSQATLHYTADKKKPLTDYVLIDLTENALTYFPFTRKKGLRDSFGATRKGPPELPLGVGDIVAVSLFESSAGGLFIPSEAGSRAGNFITLPNQTIDRDGTISVPYAGQINAVGQTPAEVQEVIERRLADRAIEPQAVITLVEKKSSQVSVLGDVNQPAKLEMNQAGESVLDMISRAGGISGPATETEITLQRSNTTATVAFKDLVDKPKENIFVYPGDVVYVSRERRTYLAFGASGLNGRIDFEESDLTLAEGVGKAGGLLDARADPGEVYLYRLVDPAILASMGFPVTAKSGAGFPTIIRANMRDPSTFFLAQQFPMLDKDIIYVSNADSVEVTKVLDIVNSVSGGVSGPVVDVAAGRTAGRLLKN
ncbi:sugar ABC transporter substrate-binding protein [Aureimonas sp. Leaf460]|nr:sugar ABC transporter substrate-binding protein [Aureimonas sp. Leaf427]KQT62226.1 sugar ABC transporter substrate-binding protein [Aureimonas sp. Leaf460]